MGVFPSVGMTIGSGLNSRTSLDTYTADWEPTTAQPTKVAFFYSFAAALSCAARSAAAARSRAAFTLSLIHI